MTRRAHSCGRALTTATRHWLWSGLLPGVVAAERRHLDDFFLRVRHGRRGNTLSPQRVLLSSAAQPCSETQRPFLDSLWYELRRRPSKEAGALDLHLFRDPLRRSGTTEQAGLGGPSRQDAASGPCRPEHCLHVSMDNLGHTCLNQR